MNGRAFRRDTRKIFDRVRYFDTTAESPKRNGPQLSRRPSRHYDRPLDLTSIAFSFAGSDDVAVILVR